MEKEELMKRLENLEKENSTLKDENNQLKEKTTYLDGELKKAVEKRQKAKEEKSSTEEKMIKFLAEQEKKEIVSKYGEDNYETVKSYKDKGLSDKEIAKLVGAGEVSNPTPQNIPMSNDEAEIKKQAKALGIDTKDKSVDTLIEEIENTDENKKEEPEVKHFTDEEADAILNGKINW